MQPMIFNMCAELFSYGAVLQCAHVDLPNMAGSAVLHQCFLVVAIGLFTLIKWPLATIGQ